MHFDQIPTGVAENFWSRNTQQSLRLENENHILGGVLIAARLAGLCYRLVWQPQIALTSLA